jgi:BioD-like phosphotransacetylase family protein
MPDTYRKFSAQLSCAGRAQELGVPIILVGDDTLTTVEKINEIIGHVRIHEFSKIDKITELTKKYIDIDGLCLIDILNEHDKNKKKKES